MLDSNGKDGNLVIHMISIRVKSDLLEEYMKFLSLSILEIQKIVLDAQRIINALFFAKKIKILSCIKCKLAMNYNKFLSRLEIF